MSRPFGEDFSKKLVAPTAAAVSQGLQGSLFGAVAWLENCLLAGRLMPVGADQCAYAFWSILNNEFSL
jgi:hypothetical protein